MQKNIGVVDRVLRIIVGLALIAYAIPLGFPHTGWNAVGYIGIVPLLTAFVGSCPLYSLVGLSTCPRS
jgi:ABC-type uncharacterized transport system permease subunit